jgi:hypothetical protein
LLWNIVKAIAFGGKNPYGVSKKFLMTGKREMFNENLADIQLQQLLEIFKELEPPFKEYIVLQIKQLVEAVKKSSLPL